LFVCYIVAQCSSASQGTSVCCISSTNHQCNCSFYPSYVGDCCYSDANACQQAYTICTANPLAKLDSSILCDCVADYGKCFKYLQCKQSDQPTIVTNCNNLLTGYKTKCPNSGLSCAFAALPKLPTVNCNSASTCSACSVSSNCQWCNQNATGKCTSLGGTCSRITPSDTTSNVFTLSGGACEADVNEVLNNFNSNNVGKIFPFFTQDPPMQAIGCAITSFKETQPTPSSLQITFTLNSNSDLNGAQQTRACQLFTNILTSLMGVVDKTRITCNPSSFTGKKRIGDSENIQTMAVVLVGQPAYITSSLGPGPANSGNNPGNNPNGGSGGGLSAGAIAGIVLFVIGVILFIIAIFVVIVLKTSNPERA